MTYLQPIMGIQSLKSLEKGGQNAKRGAANAALLFRVTSRPFAAIFLRFWRLFLCP